MGNGCGNTDENIPTYLFQKSKGLNNHMVIAYRLSENLKLGI